MRNFKYSLIFFQVPKQKARQLGYKQITNKTMEKKLVFQDYCKVEILKSDNTFVSCKHIENRVSIWRVNNLKPK